MRTEDVPRLDLTPADLRDSVHENLFDLFPSFRRLPGAELAETGGGITRYLWWAG